MTYSEIRLRHHMALHQNGLSTSSGICNFSRHSKSRNWMLPSTSLEYYCRAEPEKGIKGCLLKSIVTKHRPSTKLQNLFFPPLYTRNHTTPTTLHTTLKVRTTTAVPSPNSAPHLPRAAQARTLPCIETALCRDDVGDDVVAGGDVGDDVGDNVGNAIKRWGVVPPVSLARVLVITSPARFMRVGALALGLDSYTRWRSTQRRAGRGWIGGLLRRVARMMREMPKSGGVGSGADSGCGSSRDDPNIGTADLHMMRRSVSCWG